MRLCCIVVLLVASCAPALAQEPAAPLKRLIISERAIALSLEKHPPAPPAQTRDSVKNGAVIGAVVGAIALAAPGAWICHMLKEPGDPPCWKGILTIGAIGAGVGAAAGAGVDALFVENQRSMLRHSR